MGMGMVNVQWYYHPVIAVVLILLVIVCLTPAHHHPAGVLVSEGAGRAAHHSGADVSGQWNTHSTTYDFLHTKLL